MVMVTVMVTVMVMMMVMVMSKLQGLGAAAEQV